MMKRSIDVITLIALIDEAATIAVAALTFHSTNISRGGTRNRLMTDDDPSLLSALTSFVGIGEEREVIVGKSR